MRRTVVVVVLLCGVMAGGCEDEPSREAWRRVDEAALPDELERPREGTQPVTMEPAGTWHVAEAPETFISFQGIEADIAWTLGVGEGQQAMVYKDRLERLNEMYFEQIPGFEMDLTGVSDLGGAGSVGREVFYDLDPEVFMVDPRLPLVFWRWDAEDVERAASEVAPFFGNFIRKQRGEQWGPSYKQYTLDEALSIYAKLFDREQRYRRFAAFRDAMLRRIDQALPPRERRPKVMLVNAGSKPDEGKFYLVNLDVGDEGEFAGTWVQPFRELGLRQAFDFEKYIASEWSQVDFETMLAIDPEVIIVVWSFAMYPTAESFERGFVKPLREHPIGRTLRAVRNDRVLPGGTAEQGPLTHLFQVEMMAKQVFPELFGPWRWGQTPQRPLFDRAELGRILAGESEDLESEGSP